jgi:hypothetical protein
MKYIFQIPIILLMLWASGVSYATHSVAYNPPEKDAVYLSSTDKDAIVGDLVGSTAGLAVQVLDNDDISPELRSQIQIVAFALSLPQIGISIVDAVTTARKLRKNHPNDYDAVQEGLALRREAARRDLEGFDDAWDFVRTNPKGADAWELLLDVESNYRKDRSALIKLVDDIDVNPNLESFLRNNPQKINAWELIRNSLYSHDIDVLNYVDELKNGALLGTSNTTNYRSTFFNAFPNFNWQGNNFNVHHAIEKDLLEPSNRFYGIFTESEIHSLQNLRGISGEINSQLHLSQIRISWNDFYNQFPLGTPLPSKQQFLDKATEIDNMFGNLFTPPIRSL